MDKTSDWVTAALGRGLILKSQNLVDKVKKEISDEEEVLLKKIQIMYRESYVERIKVIERYLTEFRMACLGKVSLKGPQIILNTDMPGFFRTKVDKIVWELNFPEVDDCIGVDKSARVIFVFGEGPNWFFSTQSLSTERLESREEWESCLYEWLVQLVKHGFVA